MGWTSVRRDRGVSDDVFFADSCETFVATSSSQDAFYAAVRMHNNPDMVFCRVFLKEWEVDVRHGTNFRYKEMLEDEGPYAASPSREVLAALTETDNEYAVAWRARARERLTGVGW